MNSDKRKEWVRFGDLVSYGYDDREEKQSLCSSEEDSSISLEESLSSPLQRSSLSEEYEEPSIYYSDLEEDLCRTPHPKGLTPENKEKRVGKVVVYSDNQAELLCKRAQSVFGLIPKYELVKEEGFQHQGSVIFKVTLGELSAVGKGKRKSNAVNEAARLMLEQLKDVRQTIPDLLARCGPVDSVDRFVLKQKLLIDLETAANAGSLCKDSLDELVKDEPLTVVSTTTPVYGGTNVTFFNTVGSRSGDVRVGCSVSLRGWEEEMFGIVTAVGEGQVSVSVKESGLVFSLSDEFQLEKLDGTRIFRRLKTAVESAKNPTKVYKELRDVLFGLKEPVVTQLTPKRLEFINNNLDRSQKSVVEFALRQQELTIIHGPPGTGKTTSVVEIILQVVREDVKVLVSAPSNVAVDNLLEMLMAYQQDESKGDFIRLGHPARVSEQLQQFTLDVVVQKKVEKVESLRQEIYSIQTVLDSASDGVTRERRQQRQDMEQLVLELARANRTLEQAKRRALARAKVVLGTLTCCEPEGPLKDLPPNHFGLTVIDEVAQALEAACWLVIPQSPRLLLAGDHLQLPPTIVSKNREVVRGLSFSLMERLLNRYGPWDQRVVKMLTIQYRMNSKIMQWSSDTFYYGRLYADPLVAHRTLAGLDHVELQRGLTDSVLLMVDTAGCKMLEVASGDTSSVANVGEATIVCHLVRRLHTAGLRSEDLGVITTYAKQVELLDLNLNSEFPELEIKSVDGFQGREKEAIILSLVRSNQARKVGFLVESRRLNVAVTRARRQLILVCDSSTVSNDPFIKSFVDYMWSEGRVVSARQFGILPDIKVPPGYLPKKSKSKKKKRKKGRK